MLMFQIHVSCFCQSPVAFGQCPCTLTRGLHIKPTCEITYNIFVKWKNKLQKCFEFYNGYPLGGLLLHVNWSSPKVSSHLPRQIGTPGVIYIWNVHVRYLKSAISRCLSKLSNNLQVLLPHIEKVMRYKTGTFSKGVDQPWATACTLRGVTYHPSSDTVTVQALVEQFHPRVFTVTPGGDVCQSFHTHPS